MVISYTNVPQTVVRWNMKFGKTVYVMVYFMLSH